MKEPKLTDKKLKSFKPEKKRYRVYIDNLPGLYLLVGVTGNITFQFRYQLRAVRREIKIGSYPARTMQNLLAEYATLVDQVKNEIDPLREKELKEQKGEDNPLFKDFAERFIKNHVKKVAPTTAKEYERQIQKYFIPAWGKRKVADIQRKQIVNLIEKLSDSAPVMANRTLAGIKAMLAYGVSVGVIEFNPATGIVRPGKETPRARVLSIDELVIMFNAVDGHNDRDASDILRLITLTAQRPGEVRGMRLSQLKEDVDGLWFELESDDTKNEEPTRVYLNDMAAQIIKSRIDDMGLDNYIFPAKTKADKPGDPSSFIRKDTLVSKVRRLQPLMQEQGVKYFTAHDLRRSAATGLARLGHGAIVDDILNHKQQGITRRVYDLYSRTPEIKRALLAWGEAVQRAIDGTQADVIEINSKEAQVK